MLKHLKMKAASLQQDAAEEKPSDRVLPKEQRDKDVMVTETGKVSSNDDSQNKLYVDPISSKLSDPLDPTSKMSTSYSKNTGTSRCEIGTQSGSFGFCRTPTGTPPDINDWEHLPSGHYDLKAHTNNSEHLYNTFKATCSDPSCHCSPKNVYPFSPKIEENCSCISCQQYHRMVHLNSPSYYHSTAHHGSPHLRHPVREMFYSPDQSFPHHKPFYHSPFSHGAMDWNRFADATEFNPPRHSFNTSTVHHQHPHMQRSNSSFGYPTNYQKNEPKERNKLSLPLSRSTIFSLVKNGECDAILQTLDGPLHDEASPIYPLALQTVLEILDVIEKEFSDAYKSDRKVEADINQLSNFVKSMKMSTCGDSANNSYPDRDVMPHNQVKLPAAVTNPAAQCPDISSVSTDASKGEDTFVGNKHPIPADQLPTSTKLHNATPTVHAVNDGDIPIILPGTSDGEIGFAKQHQQEADHDNQVTDDIAEKLAAFRTGATLQSKDDSENIEDSGQPISDDSGNHSNTDLQKAGKSFDQKESKSIQPNASVERTSEVISVDPKLKEINEDNLEIQRDVNSLLTKAVDEPANDIISVDGVIDDIAVHQKNKEQNNLPDQQIEKEMPKSTSKMTNVPLSSKHQCNVTKSNVDDVAEKNFDMDVVDALLDQTLYEAACVKVKIKNQLKKSFSEEIPSKLESSNTRSLYRGKGYKVRSVGGTEKVSKFVKTFSQIREKDAISVSDGKPVDESLLMKAVKIEKKDENGNILQIPPLVIPHKSGSECGIANQNTPEIGKCPSNPLSPTSDNLDCTELKSLLEKSNVNSSAVAREDDKASKDKSIKNITSSEVIALDAIRNIPLPKEPVRQSGVCKPLIAKSFHGKLLLQKHSNDSPHTIPLELIDSNMILRDPRLSLSNLMDRQRHFELHMLHWKDEECRSIQGEKPPADMPHNLLAINVRDPRIRRRLSDDGSVPVTNKTLGVTNNSEDVSLSSSLPSSTTEKVLNMHEKGFINQSLESSESSFKGMEELQANVVKPETLCEVKENVSVSASQVTEKSKSTVPNERTSVTQPIAKAKGTILEATKLSKDIKLAQISTNSNAESVKTLPLIINSNNKTNGNNMLDRDNNKSTDRNDGTALGLNTVNPSQQTKMPRSVIYPVKEGHSADKIDTMFSFKESLSVLKSIKGDIKKKYTAAKSKIENVDKGKLIQRVSDLRKAVEIGLSTTEAHKKTATGRRFTNLTGLLEDHFILFADLFILGLWLEGFDPTNKNLDILPEFSKGVFGRQAAPSLRKIRKWLKNRYELDGLTDGSLTKLVSSIGEHRDGKRSRSRSSSTGSERSKRRRSGSSHERHQKHGSAKKLDVENKDVGKASSANSKRSSSPKKKQVSPLCSKPEHISSTTAAISSSGAEYRKDDNQPPGSSESSDSGSDVGKSPVVQEHESKRKLKSDEEKNDGKSTKKRKQSVSVSKGIQDLPQEMEDIKQDVLIALRTRNTKDANRCLEDLPEISKKAHAQLEDENKTYTSLKNVSPDTKARFADVIKGIQRLIVDCEILIYSLSWKVNRGVARRAKDNIWNIAQKSSHKPSYEEELALLLSLRKTYLVQDLWKYIKNDVDDRIDSLQKKCRSRESGGKNLPVGNQDYTTERRSSWVKSKAVIAPEPLQQLPPAMHQTTLEFENVPSGRYRVTAEGFMGTRERYNGPPEMLHMYPIPISQPPPPPMQRNNYMERPVQTFPHMPVAMPYPTEYPPNAPAPRDPYQGPSFGPPREERQYDWWRHDKGSDEWNVRSGTSSSGSVGYGSRPSFGAPQH